MKSNEIVNRLNRTKREEFPNLEARREAYDAEVGPLSPPTLQCIIDAVQYCLRAG